MTDFAFALLEPCANGNALAATATPPARRTSRRESRERGMGGNPLAEPDYAPARIELQSNDARDLPRSQRDHSASARSVGGDAPARSGELRQPVVGARRRAQGAAGARRCPREDRGAARRVPGRSDL